MELKPFRKNFYIPHNNVKNRSQQDVDEFQDVNDIIVRGNTVPCPNLCFEEGNFPDYIMQVILKQGFADPTAIQSQGNTFSALVWSHNFFVFSKLG